MVGGPVEEASGGAAGRGGGVGWVGHENVKLGDGAVVDALVEILADVAHLGGREGGMTGVGCVRTSDPYLERAWDGILVTHGCGVHESASQECAELEPPCAYVPY